MSRGFITVLESILFSLMNVALFGVSTMLPTPKSV